MKQPGFILLNKKASMKYSWTPISDSKTQEKNKAMKQDFFKRIPTEEECDLNAQFICIFLREKVFFQKILYLSPFFAFYELF